MTCCTITIKHVNINLSCMFLTLKLNNELVIFILVFLKRSIDDVLDEDTLEMKIIS